MTREVMLSAILAVALVTVAAAAEPQAAPMCDGKGSCTISLRDLKGRRTIVLVDGRRGDPLGEIPPGLANAIDSQWKPPQGVLAWINVQALNSDAISATLWISDRPLGHDYNNLAISRSILMSPRTYAMTAAMTRRFCARRHELDPHAYQYAIVQGSHGRESRCVVGLADRCAYLTALERAGAEFDPSGPGGSFSDYRRGWCAQASAQSSVRPSVQAK
jgi:hypothetical protein